MPRCHSRLELSLLALCCVSLFSGCFSVPTTPLRQQVCASPTCCRDNIHIIFVDSTVDVARISGFDHMADSICAAGFRNTHYYNPYLDGGPNVLAEKIRNIRCCNRCARIVVIGWSISTLTVDNAVKSLENTGVVVDTVVHLDSFVLREFKRFSPDSFPKNVRRNVFIYRDSNPPPKGAPNSVVYSIDEPFHLSMPGNCQANDALLRELLLYRNRNCQCSCHTAQATTSSENTITADETLSADAENAGIATATVQSDTGE